MTVTVIQYTSTHELFNGLYKHLQEKLVLLKSGLCHGNHQVVLAHNNSSTWLKHALVKNLAIVQTNKLTFLMACTWENVTFAPEGNKREGTLRWHFGLIHFYNPCTMKVNFWVQEFLSSCLHLKRNQREVILRSQCAEIKEHMAQQSGVLALVFASYTDKVKRKGGRTEGGWLLWSTANVYVPLLAAAPDGLPAAWQTSSWHQRLLCMNRGVCQKIFVSIHHGKSLQSQVQIRRWPESYWIRHCSSGRDVSMLWHWPMEGQRLASIRCQSHDTSRWWIHCRWRPDSGLRAGYLQARRRGWGNDCPFQGCFFYCNLFIQ